VLQRGHLPRPYLHSIKASFVLTGCFIPALNPRWIGYCGFRGVLGIGRENVSSADRTTETTAEGAGHHGTFRLKFRETICPGRMDFGFGTSQQSSSNGHRTRTQGQRSCHTPPVSYSAGGDKWKLCAIRNARQQGERRAGLALRSGIVEGSAMPPGLEKSPQDAGLHLGGIGFVELLPRRGRVVGAWDRRDAGGFKQVADRLASLSPKPNNLLGGDRHIARQGGGQRLCGELPAPFPRQMRVAAGKIGISPFVRWIGLGCRHRLIDGRSGQILANDTHWPPPTPLDLTALECGWG